MKLFVVGLVSLLGGAALVTLAGDKMSSSATFPAPQRSAEDGRNDPLPSIESRLRALEEALIAEQGARQMLEEELFYLMDSADATSDPISDSTEQARADSQARLAERRAARRGSNSRERRAERLVAAGFDAATADWILTRESELQMESLRTRYEASRNGETVDFYQQDVGLRAQLRQQLGDAGYERYLTANGRPLHVSINSVLDSSPAQSAGLRTGDQIVNYGGKRIYSMSDLTQEIIQGTPNERVVVHFVRDGIPMQVVLPRGPVGITGS
jgi:C-terminal processing protease CtpA/Prc